jgi:hypothetical protein
VRSRVELRFEVVAGSSRSIALRVAALNDESRLYAVELKAIVKSCIRELHERGRMKRRVVRKEVKDDIAVRGRDSHLGAVRTFGVLF